MLKLDLLHKLNLLPLISSIKTDVHRPWPAPPRGPIYTILTITHFLSGMPQDEDFQTKLAKLANAIGVELVYGWTAVGFFRRPTPPPRPGSVDWPSAHPHAPDVRKTRSRRWWPSRNLARTLKVRLHSLQIRSISRPFRGTAWLSPVVCARVCAHACDVCAERRAEQADGQRDIGSYVAVPQRRGRPCVRAHLLGFGNAGAGRPYV
jgi:hypothetical protein